MKNLDELKEALHKGEVEFTYVKKNGDVRNAKGTLNEDIIAKNDATPQGKIDASKRDNVLVYYDVNSNGWRSCIISNIEFDK